MSWLPMIHLDASTGTFWRTAGGVAVNNAWLSEVDNGTHNFEITIVVRDAATKQELGRNDSTFHFAPPVVGMEAEAYNAMISDIKAIGTEYQKLDALRQYMRNTNLTAKQLGPILDQFSMEYIRLDAARAAAPRVVDPARAMGHASKFAMKYIAEDYRKLFAGR
jgi:Domain of unknown function (DUF4476)